MIMASTLGGTPVHIASTAFAALFSLTIIATASGNPQQMQQPDVLANPMPVIVNSLDVQKETAGLASNSKPRLLTWETAYSLAVVRARSGGGELLSSLDPVGLSRQVDRLGLAAFSRFKTDLIERGTFRDPAPDILALSARLQMIENARWRIAFLENLTKLLVERIQGESSGLSRLDLDVVFAALSKCRQNFDHQKTLFRDELDELKVALGLSPQVAVILDRKTMAGFQEAFEAVATWQRQPNRHIDDLYKLTDAMPDPGELILDGKPALGAAQANPDQWVEALAKATRLALDKRGNTAQGAAEAEARVGLELKIRRRVAVWSNCVAPTSMPHNDTGWPFVSGIRHSNACSRHVPRAIRRTRSRLSESSNKPWASRRSRINWPKCGPASVASG